jgi:hypothetical protein
MALLILRVIFLTLFLAFLIFLLVLLLAFLMTLLLLLLGHPLSLSSQTSSLNADGILVILNFDVGSLAQTRRDGSLSHWISAVFSVDSLASFVRSSWFVSTGSDGTSLARFGRP